MSPVLWRTGDRRTTSRIDGRPPGVQTPALGPSRPTLQTYAAGLGRKGATYSSDVGILLFRHRLHTQTAYSSDAGNPHGLWTQEHFAVCYCSSMGVWPHAHQVGELGMFGHTLQC